MLYYECQHEGCCYRGFVPCPEHMVPDLVMTQEQRPEITIGTEWFVFANGSPFGNGPMEPWCGAFDTRQKAEEWMALQNNWPKGLRVGRKAIVWT